MQHTCLSQTNSFLFESLPTWLLLKLGMGSLVFISSYWTETFASFSVTWEGQGEFHVANTSYGLQTRVYKYSPQKKFLQGKAVKSSVTALLVAEPWTGNAKGIAGPPCATRGFYLVQLKPGRKVMKVRKWTLNPGTWQCSSLVQKYFMAVLMKPYSYALFWNVVCWEEQHQSANSNSPANGFFLYRCQNKSRNHSNLAV